MKRETRDWASGEPRLYLEDIRVVLRDMAGSITHPHCWETWWNTLSWWTSTCSCTLHLGSSYCTQTAQQQSKSMQQLHCDTNSQYNVRVYSKFTTNMTVCDTINRHGCRRQTHLQIWPNSHNLSDMLVTECWHVKATGWTLADGRTGSALCFNRS